MSHKKKSIIPKSMQLKMIHPTIPAEEIRSPLPIKLLGLLPLTAIKRYKSNGPRPLSVRREKITAWR